MYRFLGQLESEEPGATTGVKKSVDKVDSHAHPVHDGKASVDLDVTVDGEKDLSTDAGKKPETAKKPTWSGAATTPATALSDDGDLPLCGLATALAEASSAAGDPFKPSPGTGTRRHDNDDAGSAAVLISIEDSSTRVGNRHEKYSDHDA